MAPLIAFAAEIKEGVGIQSLMTFGVGFGPLLVFLASFINKESVWKLRRFDFVCGILALVGLFLWYTTKNGNFAIFFSILADGSAAVPTLVKSYYFPETENYHVYLTAAISAAITLLTIEIWDFAHFGFPIYILILCITLVLLIKFRTGKLFRVGTGLDPQELPPVLQFVAKNGHIWLQYAVENGQRIPTGVIEFIPLLKALEYRPEDISAGDYDLSISPLNIIMENQERVFADTRRFAKDEDIIYHHGIAMVRRGGGYGTLLMRYALDNTSYVKNRAVVCFPDAATNESGKLELAPNEDSFTVHLKAGFVLTGVVNPPVYDESLTYYSFIRPAKGFYFPGRDYRERLNLAEGDAKSVLEKVRKLTKDGFVGNHYNKETHVMEFQRPAKS